MDVEPTPFFDEVLARPEFHGLFDEDAKWAALIADPTEELVPVPPPSFQELLDGLKDRLPTDVVVATANSIDAERFWQEVDASDLPEEDIETTREIQGEETNHADEGDVQPVRDAEGAEPGGGELVGGDDDADPAGPGDG